MKIANYEGDAVKRKRIVLEREGGNIELLITALPSSYMGVISERLPEPIPPSKKTPMRDAQTGKFVTDKNTGARIYPPNLEDPGYRVALAEHQNLTTVAIAHYAVKGDPNVEFETEEGDSGSDFYRSIRDEMEEFGVNMGDLAHIVQEVVTLTGLTEEDIEEAREDFLDQEQTD